MSSYQKKTKAAPPSTVLTLPPPPPNEGTLTFSWLALITSTLNVISIRLANNHILIITKYSSFFILLADCTAVACSEPLTNTPPGSPCGCVWPIQVKISLSVSIYTFFQLVSELAEEIAAAVSLNHSQVRIMGADAASQQLEKTSVLINLVPKGLKFNDTTALFIYKRFWHREVSIKASVFGAYEVFYVHYPGNILFLSFVFFLDKFKKKFLFTYFW